jgi:hypothetical protein
LVKDEVNSEERGWYRILGGSLGKKKSGKAGIKKLGLFFNGIYDCENITFQ